MSTAEAFVWRIPQLNHVETRHLVLGYIRSSVVCNGSPDDRLFDNDIINLCIASLLSSSLESGLLNRMKNARIGQGFMSEPFSMNGYNHILEFFPCGIDKASENKLCCKLHVLLSNEQSSHHISTNLKLTFTHSKFSLFSKSYSSLLRVNECSISMVSTLNIKDIERLSISVEI